MRNSRSIDLTNARRPGVRGGVQAQNAPAGRTAERACGPQRAGARTPAEAPHRGRAPARAAQRAVSGGAAAPAAKKKHSAAKRVLAIVLCALVLGGGGFYAYVSHMLNSGNSAVKNTGLSLVLPPVLTKDQMNILVLGLDYDDVDAVERSKNNPQADMILYVQLDQKAKTIKMLQIPRDSYVGDKFGTGGTGKINATYAHGSNQDNKVQNVVEVVNQMFQLKVDHWVTIDMKSLREMVDTFGGGAGLPVNIPYDLVEYDEKGHVKSALYAGERVLHGEELEFFLRARKAQGMNRGDLDRLDNQKIFYSAVFRYMRTMSWQEMVKLMPFFLKYVNTDISPIQCAALGVTAMKIPNENIVMGRVPVILNQSAYYGKSQVVPVAAQETADCLNRYFRPASAPVAVDQLSIPKLKGITSPVVDCEMKHIADNGTVAAETDSGAQAAG